MRKVEYPPPLQELIRQLHRMPGIGPRSAERIALWIIQAPNSRPGEISEAISRCSKAVLNCHECGFFSEGELCAICNDPARDRSVLCVVEQPTDILSLERTGAFNGVYHALGGKLSPLNHVGPEDLRFEALLQRIKQARSERADFGAWSRRGRGSNGELPVSIVGRDRGSSDSARPRSTGWSRPGERR